MGLELAYSCNFIDRKHPGYKPQDSFLRRLRTGEIKNLYPMKLAPEFIRGVNASV